MNQKKTMISFIGGLIVCSMVLQLSCKQSSEKQTGVEPSQDWSVRMAETIMKDYPQMWRMEEAENIKWAYTKGLMGDAFLALW